MSLLGSCASVLAKGIIKVYSRKLKLLPLAAEHVEAAAVLLAEQFCRREPMCRELGIQVADIHPFFLQQVRQVAEGGLGIVAVDPARIVQGVVTNLDHLDPVLPPAVATTIAVAKIGEILDLVEVPADYQPQARGELFQCTLAAVRPGSTKTPILVLMMFATHFLLKAKGYKRGYAKVTNPAIYWNMRKIERMFHLQVFRVAATLSQKDVAPGRFSPVERFRVSLIMWSLPH